MMPGGEVQLAHICCTLVVVIPTMVVGIVWLVRRGWLR